MGRAGRDAAGCPGDACQWRKRLGLAGADQRARRRGRPGRAGRGRRHAGRRRRARAAPRRAARVLVAARRRVAGRRYDRRGDHHAGRMVATEAQMPGPARSAGSPRARWPTRAFASTRALTRGQMIEAPVRWPRPSRLYAALDLPAGKMVAGLEALGLRTVGELLEHLPTDSRQARTVGTLRAGEQATVAVEVRAIATRSVRRRGMRPLVEATVADASGSMRATFFNQPWLLQRYSPGTRLLLHGKADARGGFRVSHHAVCTDGAVGVAAGPGEADAVAHYPAAEGVSSTQILTLVRAHRYALADVTEALPAPMP